MQPSRALLALVALFACVKLSVQLTFNPEAADIQSAVGNPEAAFKEWMAQYNKKYNSPQEEAARFQIWQSNIQKMLSRNLLHSKAGSSLRLGLNGLSDLTSDEFRNAFVNRKPLAPPPLPASNDSNPAPPSWRYANVKPKKEVDWRKAKVVGPIRNQHAHNWSCGSCWAFATVGITEIASAMTTGTMVPASEQQLIDCDRQHDYGCDGGDFHNGLDYVIYNKGLTSESNYPYVGHDQECDRKLEKDHAVKIDDWESVPAWDEHAMMQAISMRPVVTAVCCGDNIDDWHHYAGGVFDVECCKSKLELDHAMAVVGYGEDAASKEPYWIMKNSWGEEWGEGGFMKLKRFVTPQGQCGVASMPTMVFRGPKPPPPMVEEEAQPCWRMRMWSKVRNFLAAFLPL